MGEGGVVLFCVLESGCGEARLNPAEKKTGGTLERVCKTVKLPTGNLTLMQHSYPQPTRGDCRGKAPILTSGGVRLAPKGSRTGQGRGRGVGAPFQHPPHSP